MVTATDGVPASRAARSVPVSPSLSPSTSSGGRASGGWSVSEMRVRLIEDCRRRPVESSESIGTSVHS